MFIHKTFKIGEDEFKLNFSTYSDAKPYRLTLFITGKRVAIYLWYAHEAITLRLYGHKDYGGFKVYENIYITECKRKIVQFLTKQL